MINSNSSSVSFLFLCFLDIQSEHNKKSNLTHQLQPSYGEKESEHPERRRSGPPATFFDPGSSRIDKWLSVVAKHRWRASSSGISGIGKPPEHRPLCTPSNTSTIPHSMEVFGKRETIIEIEEFLMFESWIRWWNHSIPAEHEMVRE